MITAITYRPKFVLEMIFIECINYKKSLRCIGTVKQLSPNYIKYSMVKFKYF